MMDIKEIQAQIMDFAKKRAVAKNFELTKELSYIHLVEEIGEVARQLSSLKNLPELYDEENYKEEIVDVLLETLILAELSNVDLDSEIKKKIDTLFERHGFEKG